MRSCKYKQTLLVVVGRMSKISNIVGSNAFRETFKHSTNDVVHYFPSHMARGESKQHKTAYLGANPCVRMHTEIVSLPRLDVVVVVVVVLIWVKAEPLYPHQK